MNQKLLKNKASNIMLLFAALLMIFAIFMIVQSVLISNGVNLSSNLSIFLSESCILLPGLVYIFINKLTLSDLGIKRLKGKSILLSILLSFLAMPIAACINILTQFWVSNTLAQSSDTLLGSNSIILIFMSGVFAPICEEIAFRCIINKQLTLISSVISSALISSFLFGWMHLNINQACYAFVLGLLLCLANHASGSTITSMIIHMVFNIWNMIILVISSQFTAEAGLDTSIATQAESLRNDTSSLLILFFVYFGISVVALILYMVVIKALAKAEGRTNQLQSLIKNKNVTEDDSIDKEELKISQLIVNIPMLLAIGITLFILFGMEPLLNLILS